MSSTGQYSAFTDVAIVEALRTPWVDLGGALAQVSPIDMGIKVGREVLARAGLDGRMVDSVLAGSMAQASFDAYMLPRHIGLYSGVAHQVPALAVHRICATGFELLHQAAGQVRDGMQLALLKSTMPKDGPQMTRGEKIRIFLFGVFELLVWQKKIKDQLKK